MTEHELQPQPASERVEVNTHALVHKVLARYPEDFAVFRELLQNADDAEATEARIEFQTSDYVNRSTGVGANSEVNENMGITSIPDWNTIKLSKWIIRNDGNTFGDQDWDRLVIIGDGNPGLQKVGAFGVGFYSVFSVTDRPLVKSGGKKLSMFFLGNELCTELVPCQEEKWTSIEMKLKEDVQGSVPKPFDLARFLAATMTFVSHLKIITVFFDDNVVLKIAKPKEINSHTGIPLPPKMVDISKERTMNIKTVSAFIEEISVEITDWAVAAGTKRPLAQRLDEDSAEHSFWYSSEHSQSETPTATPPSPTSACEKRIHTASYAVYSAEVTTDPSDDLHKNLNAMTKKGLPSNFKFEMIYFSKEQHDARATEETDATGSVFRGPQGLFPQLDGERQYMSRVFIGQSTAQTTGIGGHISGSFIPTVERGSIDLTNCHIAKWNRELLYVGGFLARLAYETEMDRVLSTWPKNEPTTSLAVSSSRDEALYIMHYFSFHTSTPDDNISKILRDAFFDCSRSDCFPILSDSGIRYTKDVRQPHKDFSSFMKEKPVLLSTELGNSPRLIDILPDQYKVSDYKLSDVVDELKRRILQEDEVIGFLQWLVVAYPQVSKYQAEVNDETRRKVTTQVTQLEEEARFKIGDREVALRSISKFVDSKAWLGLLQSDDPLPPDTIPFSFTNTLDQNIIPSTLGWQPMSIVDWLRHLINPHIDEAHNICRNEIYSNRVLGILGILWSRLPSDVKSETKKLMKDVRWIKTNEGFLRAEEISLSRADDANVTYQIRTVLTGLGVNKYHQSFPPLEKLRELSAEQLVQYFWQVLIVDHTRREDIQGQAVFPCKKGGRCCCTELYIPRHNILGLGLPILDLHQVVDADEFIKLLIWLGFLLHPPLDKVIEIAGSNDRNTRGAAFAYLSENFDSVYESTYNPSKYTDKAFIPATKGDEECIGALKDVYSDNSWEEMGFWTVHRSVDSRMRRRLQIRESPTPKRLIEVFSERAPTDYSTAGKWFAVLAKNPGLTPDDIQRVARLTIVPIGDQRMLPRECFLGGDQYPDDHHYRRIFPFVDFGEHGNKFLKACGAKFKPDCYDVISTLVKDPGGFFRGTKANNSDGPDRYLTELRSIAVRYDGLSEMKKEEMKKAAIFIGYRASGKYESKLVKASEIMVADNMEMRQMFGDSVLLAPRDELLETLCKSMGSEDLSSHIKYDVTYVESSTNPAQAASCEVIRETILQKLPIFLHGLEKRLKNSSTYLKWKDRSKFCVRGCEDLKVEIRLDRMSQQPGIRSKSYPVCAEITTIMDCSTLWLKKVDPVNMHDVATALCRLLLKTYKICDVVNLMIILETGKSDLESRGYNGNCSPPLVAVDSQRNSETRNGDKGQTIGRKEDTQTQLQPKPLNDKQYGRGAHSPSGSFHGRSQVDLTPPLKPHGSLVDEVVKRLTDANAIPQEIMNRGCKDVGNKSKDAKYCAEQNLEECKDFSGPMKVWKHKTAKEAIPPDSLYVFQTIIRDLCNVFGAHTEFFNIFWHPSNPEIMGFNRNRLIFLNLAHYTVKHANLKAGEVYIEWYQTIVHEIAHHEAPFHDERHELIVSGLSSHFLQLLHLKVEAVRKYFKCTMVSSQ